MGEELTLEECFSGLEEIIEKMQDTEVSLEDSFALYEQGMKMLKNCSLNSLLLTCLPLASSSFPIQ